MKLRGLELTLRCPEHGLLSLRCAHRELEMRPIGFALMAVGAVSVALAFTELL